MFGTKAERARARRTFLSVETLEERTVLAGNVLASITGGNLRLIGDAQSNQIAIERTGPQSVQISSLDSSTRINNQAGPITLNGFTSGMVAVLGGGDDVLRFSGTSTELFRVFGNAVIDTGTGNDTVEFSNHSVWNNLVLTTGAGNDRVIGLRDLTGAAATTGWGLRVGQNAVINTGAGDDEVNLRNSAFLKNFVLDAGTGNDRVDLRNNEFQFISVHNGGPGFDTLNNVGNTFRYNPVIFQFESQTAIAGPTAAADSATVLEGGSATINVLANDSATSGAINTGSVVITQQPTRGTVVVNANGTVTYTNNGSEGATDSFRYTVRDAQGNLSNEATVSLAITPVNDLPVAVNDTITVAEGGSASLNLSTNDTDAENQLNRNSIVIVTQPANGTISIGNNGSVTYTHNGSETTTDSFTYTIADAQGGASAAATVNVVVTPVNDLPTIAGVPTTTVTVNEDTAAAPITLTIGDAETPVGQLTLAATSSNTAVVAASGIALTGTGAQRTLTITPVANASGSSTITLTLTDANGGVTTRTFQVNVNAENDLPTITPDIQDIVQNEDTTIAPITVTVSDVEAQASALGVTATSSNTGVATVSVAPGVNANQRIITVTPVANASGTTTITLSVSDGAGGTATQQFNVTLNPVNDAPTVTQVNDLTVAAGTTVAPITVTVGDVETPAANLQVTATSSNQALVDAGDIVVTTNGNQRTIQITPNVGATGSSTITLSVSDGNLTTTETFVLNVNAAPTISNVVDIVADEDQTIPSFTVNVGDVETPVGNLTVTAASSNTALIPSANLSVSGNTGTRTVVITPVANASGTSTITLTVTDSNGLTTQETFLVTVNPVNDLPTVTGGGNVTTNEDVPVTVPLTIGDIETLPANLIVTVSSSNTAVVANDAASLQLSGTGGARTLLVTPVADASGTTTLTVTVQDAAGATATYNFNVTVNPVNDAPDTTIDTASVLEGSVVNIQVAANDTDVDGTLDLSSVVITDQPQFGTVVVEQDGSITYTNSGSVNTADSFSYAIRDNSGTLSAETAVDIAITLINDPPEVTDDVRFMIEPTNNTNVTISGNVLDNDDDEETPDNLFISALSDGTLGVELEGNYGFLTLNADGTYSYELDAELSDSLIADVDAADVFSFLVSDGTDTTTALLTINIEGRNG